MREIAWGHYVGHSTVCVIIKETTRALWEVLAPLVLKVPSTKEWSLIAEGYFKRWNMPNCVGAIDGKHISIQAPAHAGSTFFNYKKHHSIVLMATCDAYNRFTLIDIGAAGSNYDSVVFSSSGFGQAVLNKTLSLPSHQNLPNSGIRLPNFSVADAAFPLTEHVMLPYPGERLGVQQRIYNFRLSRARRTINNTFGILANRWRILRRPIIADVSTCEDIVKATVVLHNFLQRSEEEIPERERKYCPTGYADEIRPDGSILTVIWRNENVLRSVGRLGSNNPKRLVKTLRDNLCDYLKVVYPGSSTV